MRSATAVAAASWGTRSASERRLSLVPHLLADALPSDVIMVQTSTPVDETVSLGIEVNILPAAIEADEPLATPAPRVLGDIARTIGERVGNSYRSTPPCSSGSARSRTPCSTRSRPDAGSRSGRRCSATGVLALEKAGAGPGNPITASFAFGSQELYDWMDRNPRVRMFRTEKTNDPGLIARQPRLVSVNSALQVDLFAQANAVRVRGVIYSGFGG